MGKFFLHHYEKQIRPFLIYDWEHPAFSEKAKNWTELNKALSNALNKLEK